MSTLVIAATLDASVVAHTYELITAAQELGEPITVALLSAHASALAEELNVAGVDTIIPVPMTSEQFESDAWRETLTRLIRVRAPQRVLMNYTINSAAVAGAIAADLGLGFAADVIAMQLDAERLTVTRPLHGGKAHAELRFPQIGRQLLLLRSGIWPINDGAGNATFETFSPGEHRRRVRHLGFEDLDQADEDLGSAELVLGIGRGVGDSKAVPRFEELANQLGAALAASRPVVDRGWLPRTRQVGQSGVTVKPRVYLALGISGAPQHLAGMLGSEIIIAVNADPGAPIFDIAHYGAAVDLFLVADALAEQLAAQPDA
jgi:electron transfer flavoprotein alpha subunit